MCNIFVLLIYIIKHVYQHSSPALSSKPIHTSDMSIIQKYLTNQIAADGIIIVITPYCPTY